MIQEGNVREWEISPHFLVMFEWLQHFAAA